MEKQIRHKIFIGKVVSVGMNKTVVVEVMHTIKHPVYKKVMKRTKRILSHNEIVDLVVGNQVRIEETKPISKNKHFRVLERINA